MSLLLIGLLVMTGCKKIIDPGKPLNSVLPEDVFNNDVLAERNVAGIYIEIEKEFNLLNGAISKNCALGADELELLGGTDTDQEFLQNALTATNTSVKKAWEGAYRYISFANIAIAGLTGSKGLTAKLRDQLLGECYFLRALTYLHLVNLFGDVPLVLLGDYMKNSSIERTSSNKVYEQILSDLTEAIQLLPVGYVTKPDYPTERVRVNKMAAYALMARVQLYLGQWQAAEEAATAVIQNQLYHLEEDLTKIFIPESNEAILQFLPVGNVYYSAEGALFIPPGGKPVVFIADSLLNAFEAGDRRKAVWLRALSFNGKTYYYPYKYNVRVRAGASRKEYNTVLRLAEQYLIRAEAQAQQNKIVEAIRDLNVIRTRADLPLLPETVAKATALSAIEHERRIELFSEWGHRWFDLKRLPAHTLFMKKRINDVMSVQKPQTWEIDDALWPLPIEQLTLNPKLVQNPGY